MTQSSITDRIRLLNQTWPEPTKKRPIVIIGAGSIVTMPICRPTPKAAMRLRASSTSTGNRRAKSPSSAAYRPCSILCGRLCRRRPSSISLFPPVALLSVVRELPRETVTVLQKPLGANLNEAREICRIVRERSITAKVNFQLRFSPLMLALRDAIDQGMLGEITDVDLHLTARQPWECWPHMEALEAMKWFMHSIHYMDWIRSVLGEPPGSTPRA